MYCKKIGRLETFSPHKQAGFAQMEIQRLEYKEKKLEKFHSFLSMYASHQLLVLFSRYAFLYNLPVHLQLGVERIPPSGRYP